MTVVVSFIRTLDCGRAFLNKQKYMQNRNEYKDRRSELKLERWPINFQLRFKILVQLVTFGSHDFEGMWRGSNLLIFLFPIAFIMKLLQLDGLITIPLRQQ